MGKKIKVTIWNEGRHEQFNAGMNQVYPLGIHGTIKAFLEQDEDLIVRTTTLDSPEQGLPDELLNDTDVLLWWAHVAHAEVNDGLVERIRNRVWNEGMGFVPLHSSHFSKPFRSIVGTSGCLTWGDDQHEILWTLLPQHPIAAGIPEYVDLGTEELYSEPFRVPVPEELVFGSWYEGGSLFRSGLCYYRGIGKIFYFQPGHETCASFHNPYVQKIITNAVHWAAPDTFAFDTPTENQYRYNPLVEIANGGVMKRVWQG